LDLLLTTSLQNANKKIKKFIIFPNFNVNIIIYKLVYLKINYKSA